MYKCRPKLIAVPDQNIANFACINELYSRENYLKGFESM